MFGRSAMVLVTALLMFPQIVETIYSPALTDISRYFSVSAVEATQTLSVYFIGFAIGVLYWGRFSDRYGRRPALLAGLAAYALGCVLALAARDFTLLLVARMLSAFGAATGSVVSQTILRDRFNGRQLAALFSVMGLVLAVSPAAGVYLGGAIVAGWGMHGVLTALALLAAVLLLLCCWLLPETRPSQHVHTAFLPLLRRMAREGRIVGRMKPDRAIVDDAFHLRTVVHAGRYPGRPGGRQQAQQRAVVEGQSYAALTGKKQLSHPVQVAAGIMLTQRRAHANHSVMQILRIK